MRLLVAGCWFVVQPAESVQHRGSLTNNQQPATSNAHGARP
jgi:hypothetical protein